jgi:hypothetical protein
VRLWLSLIAYNLGNLWRRLALPKKIENWSRTSLQQWLVKTGGRLVKHARYYWLMLAEIGPALAWELIQTFLKARFSGAVRHHRRVDKVKALEMHEAAR